MGVAEERHFTNYHLIPKCAVWQGWFAVKILLACRGCLSATGKWVHILVAETIERYNSSKIKTKWGFRDTVHSDLHQLGANFSGIELG
jgi:hypothetical protein